VPVHAYTTAVVSDDGFLQAEILSLPNFVRAEVAAPEEVVDELARSLNVDSRSSTMSAGKVASYAAWSGWPSGPIGY
jgi:hypothetical protein